MVGDNDLLNTDNLLGCSSYLDCSIYFIHETCILGFPRKKNNTFDYTEAIEILLIVSNNTRASMV